MMSIGIGAATALTCVVADDEALVRTRIVRLAEDAGLVVVGEAADGAGALAEIRSRRPDIALLDIRMPGPSGLEVLETLASSEAPPAVVLVTAYGEHALAAFALAAVDYVVKPVEPARFARAVARARADVLGREARAQLARARAALGASRPDRFSFRAGGAIRTCSLAEVRAFHACDDYVEAELAKARPLLSVRMDALEAALPAPPFLRIHRSHIVNMDMAESLATAAAGGGVLKLVTGAVLPVARARLAGARRCLQDGAWVRAPSGASPRSGHGTSS